MTNNHAETEDPPLHPDQALDELEERILGRRMDQNRDDPDAEDSPAHEQDLDEHDLPHTVQRGPGAEPP